MKMALRMGLLGKKVGMTQTFDEKGAWIPLSVVETGPCVVVDIKREDRDGYCAIKLGFDEKKERRTKKPELGMFARAKTAPRRFVREIRLAAEDAARFQIGQTLTVGQVFQVGDRVDVTGTSKGKGFQGVMKRYHFSGFRATHGTHEYFRHGGSIGCRLTPGRVVKGKHMPGQLGNKRVTMQNLTVFEVVEDKNLLIIRGSIPGAAASYLVLKHAAKRAPQPFRIDAPAADGEGEQTAEQADQA